MEFWLCILSLHRMISREADRSRVSESQRIQVSVDNKQMQQRKISLLHFYVSRSRGIWGYNKNTET